MHIRCPYPITRRARGDLPPTAPLPKAMQTLGARLRPLEYIDWCRRRIGPSFTVAPIDMPPLIFLSDPSDICAIMAAPIATLESGAAATITKPLLGETSFLLRDGDERLMIRAAVSPAFSRSVAEAHTDAIAESAHRAISSMPLNIPTPMRPRLASITMTVMLRAVFGDEHDLIPALHDGMLTMLEVTPSLVLQQPRLRHLPGWHGTWSRFTDERAHVHRLIERIVADRRRTPARHVDVLDRLLATERPDGSPMSATEVRDNLVAIIIAGHETTASTLAWALQLIAHHPAVQDAIVAELKAQDGDEYLKATINEVLRHRPVFLFATPRAVAQPIEINDVTYRAPAHLLACTYLMHHDPILYPKPHEFRPERFLGSRARASEATWLPWGGGRQRCPGRYLALLELQIVLRAVLTSLRVCPAAPELERARWRSAIVTPHAGSTVVLHKRAPTMRQATCGTARPGTISHTCSAQDAFYQR